MADSLMFQVGADTKGFQDGISGILTGLAGLVTAFLGVQAVVEAFSQAIDLGGRLHDLSTRTGESAGQLAILERAFDNTSVGAEKLGPAINKMQRSMTDMQQGSDMAVASFKQLGLSWTDLEGKSPAEQMGLIGQRLAAIEDPALRAETAMNIFGKSGAELLPILINFSEETAQARAQLGGLPEQLDKSAASVDALGDNLFAIKNKLTEMAYGFLSEVVPAIELFTSKLSGVDAASIGASLADTLVGAFANPMKAAELLGDAILLGAMNYGNLLIDSADYFGRLMNNTFTALGVSIPEIANGLIQGAEGFGTVLLSVISDGLEGMKGFTALFSSLGIVLGPAFDVAIGAVAGAKEGLGVLANEAMDAAAKTGAGVVDAFTNAYNQTEFIKHNFFETQGVSAQIAEDWAAVEKSGKELVAVLANPIQAAQGTTISQSGTELLDAINAENAKTQVNQTPTIISTSTGKTQAQLDAELKKQLGIIAGASSTQAIGQSASAQRAIDQQKQLDQLVALGKGDSAEAAALATSIFQNQQIAFGNVLTPSDVEAAHQLALDAYFKDTSQSITDLESKYQADILEQKMANDPTSAARDAKTQMDKAKEAGAGAGGSAKQQPESVMSIANSVLQILQKIEPKIPQHIMT